MLAIPMIGFSPISTITNELSALARYTEHRAVITGALTDYGQPVPHWADGEWRAELVAAGFHQVGYITNIHPEVDPEAQARALWHTLDHSLMAGEWIIGQAHHTTPYEAWETWAMTMQGLLRDAAVLGAPGRVWAMHRDDHLHSASYAPRHRIINGTGGTGPEGSWSGWCIPNATVIDGVGIIDGTCLYRGSVADLAAITCGVPPARSAGRREEQPA